jgi:succinate dehydrogenase/fumarate reductase cytochrome b subunit
MERTLARIQAVSGLLFAVFLALHLLNLFASVLGPGRYDQVQRGVRVLVHAPGYELLLLLGPLLVHAAVGVIRMRRRPAPAGRARPPLAARLHRWTAWFLLLVVFGHAAATRIPAVFFDTEVGFAGLSFALWWLPAIFYPYYILLALAGLYHGTYGTWAALRVLGVRLPAFGRLGPRIFVPLGAAALLAIVAVLSFAGALYPIADPTDNPYARFYEEYFGVELPPPGKATP